MKDTSEVNLLTATCPDTTNWNAIDWHKIEKYVDRMQKRIYHAESLKKSRKTRGFQRTLLRSKAALLLAIRRVTQVNKGRRTPGIDGVRVLNDKKRGELFDFMKNRKINLHNPKPAYRTYIKKKNGKLRPLGIPTIIDRIYQEIIRIALEPQMEARFEPTSYGFRPARGCHDALSRIMINIRGRKWCWVFEGDFQSCFDTLSHSFILKQIKGFPSYKLVEKFLKAGYVDNNVFYNTEEGTPQGGIISPLLANIALHGMEEILNITYRKAKIRGEVSYLTKGKYRMVRYADDFVIFAQNQEDIEALYDILNPYLKDRGLSLAEDKTKITHISQGFDFLGFNFRRYETKDGDKHFVKPSKASIKHFRAKIAERFKLLRGQNADKVIKSLNPLIIGTANYWKPSSAKKIFTKMDHYIWETTVRFLKRMHPNKPMKWIKKVYFPAFNNGKHVDNWVFTGPKEGNHITKMAWIPIKRHTMIKFNYSPYDSSKKEYFSNRGFSNQG